MGKWEQVARGNSSARDGMMSAERAAQLLRQCEADTIRRCAGIPEQIKLNEDYAISPAAKAMVQANNIAADSIEAAILSLLPKEPGHD